MISSLTSNYHFLTLLIVLLVLINHHQTSANSFSNSPVYRSQSPSYKDYSYDDIDESESPVFINPNDLYASDSEEMRSRNPWSQLFHRHSQRSIYKPTYYASSSPGFNLRSGTIRYISYPAEKRAIPIEFQKALFAHGIVGRRR